MEKRYTSTANRILKRTASDITLKTSFERRYWMNMKRNAPV